MTVLPFDNYKFHHCIVKINVDIDKVSLVAFHEDCPQLLIYETQDNHSARKDCKNLFISYNYVNKCIYNCLKSTLKSFNEIIP